MAKRKAAAKPYIHPITEPLLSVPCRSCGQDRELADFRLYKPGTPPQYMDFCAFCEKAYGTVTLYRRYNAYGTDAIIRDVFAANRTPVNHRTAEQKRLLVEPVESDIPETRERAIAKELARRELARRRLVFFTTTFKPGYMAGWVHHDICRRLERFVKQVEAGESPRLILCLPPRVGKSELASDQFPSWVLGNHPDWPIIATSYAQSLPLGFSRNIRTRLRDPEYSAIFPQTSLAPDSQGIEAWKTTKDGGYIAAGIGTGITGKGGKILICDDPVKDQEAADSALILENTYNWYQSTFRTRLAPGGGILLIQTRWKFNDLAGRLLEDDETLRKAGVPEYERENWELVEYPALAESNEYLLNDGSILQGEPYDESTISRKLRAKGEALHPERYSTQDMKRLRNVLPSSVWSALYQQKPTPDEGDFFKRDDFLYRWLDPAYRNYCRVFVCVDYAIGKKERNDFTVAGVFALDSSNNLYVLEIRRGRWGTFDIVANVVALVLKHKPEVYAGERGSIHAAVWPLIEQELQKQNTFLSVDETLVPIQDKQTRARPLQGRMQQKKFIFSFDDATKPEIYDISERELLQFPNGAHDDIVDCLSWGARLALNLPLPTDHRPVRKIERWQDKLKAQTREKRSFMEA
jgi:phage terminase large subunit-like protein